jgi:hypothetical protein
LSIFVLVYLCACLSLCLSIWAATPTQDVPIQAYASVGLHICITCMPETPPYPCTLICVLGNTGSVKFTFTHAHTRDNLFEQCRILCLSVWLRATPVASSSHSHTHTHNQRNTCLINTCTHKQRKSPAATAQKRAASLSAAQSSHSHSPNAAAFRVEQQAQDTMDAQLQHTAHLQHKGKP